MRPINFRQFWLSRLLVTILVPGTLSLLVLASNYKKATDFSRASKSKVAISNLQPSVFTDAPAAPGDGNWHETPSGLKYLDLAIGQGLSPQPGQKIAYLYSIRLDDGNSRRPADSVCETIRLRKLLASLDRLRIRQAGPRRSRPCASAAGAALSYHRNWPMAARRLADDPTGELPHNRCPTPLSRSSNSAPKHLPMTSSSLGLPGDSLCLGRHFSGELRPLHVLCIGHTLKRSPARFRQPIRRRHRPQPWC